MCKIRMWYSEVLIYTRKCMVLNRRARQPFFFFFWNSDSFCLVSLSCSHLLSFFSSIVCACMCNRATPDKIQSARVKYAVRRAAIDPKAYTWPALQSL